MAHLPDLEGLHLTLRLALPPSLCPCPDLLQKGRVRHQVYPGLCLGTFLFRTVVRVFLLFRRALAVPWFHQGCCRSFAWRGWGWRATAHLAWLTFSFALLSFVLLTFFFSFSFAFFFAFAALAFLSFLLPWPISVVPLFVLREWLFGRRVAWSGTRSFPRA